jgi:hypothetical protein
MSAASIIARNAGSRSADALPCVAACRDRLSRTMPRGGRLMVAYLHAGVLTRRASADWSRLIRLCRSF